MNIKPEITNRTLFVCVTGATSTQYFKASDVNFGEKELNMWHVLRWQNTPDELAPYVPEPFVKSIYLIVGFGVRIAVSNDFTGWEVYPTRQAAQVRLEALKVASGLSQPQLPKRPTYGAKHRNRRAF